MNKISHAWLFFIISILSNHYYSFASSTMIDSDELGSKDQIKIVLKKYHDLFLTPFDKRLINGDITGAKKCSEGFTSKYSCLLFKNKIDKGYYLYLRSFDNIQDSDRFHFFYFRNFNPSIQINVIDDESVISQKIFSIESTIKKMVDSATDRGSYRNFLKNSFSEQSKNLCVEWKKIENRNNLYFCYTQFMDEFIANDSVEKLVCKEIDEISNRFDSVRKEIIKAGFRKQLYKSNSGTRTLIQLAKSFKSTPEGALYSECESEELNVYKTILAGTKLKHQVEKDKLGFIKEFPSFFELSRKERQATIGSMDLDKAVQLGDGVIVGVIDMYNYCPNSVLLQQCINPQYKSEFFSEISDDSHALHVTGIILSRQISKIDNLPFGIATNAKYQMIARQDCPGFSCGRTKMDTNNKINILSDWSVSGHISMIDNFFSSEKGEFYASGHVYSWDESLGEQSNATVFNVSLAGSAYRKDCHSSANKPEFYDVIWQLRLNPKALFCIGLGNEGIEISSSPIIGRALRALAKNSKTKGRVLFSTNLLEDGMTLSKLSNVPGAHRDLQKRTLSAVGTNVESTSFQKTKDDCDRTIMSGTSMATPKITGVACVVLSNHPNLDQAALSDSMLKGATPLLYDPECATVFEIEGYSAEELSKKLASGGSFTIDAKEFSTSTSFYKPNSIEITPKWWEESQRLYGQGRVNLKGSLRYASELTTRKG